MFPRPEQVEAGHERLHGVQHIAAARGLVTPNSLLCPEYCGYVASVPASAIGAYVFNAGTLVNGVSPGAPTRWLAYVK